MDNESDTGPTVEWLTLTEAGQRVGHSTKTLRRRIKAGQLVAQRDGAGERAPWLVSSTSLLELYPVTAGPHEIGPDEAAAEAVTALSTQLTAALDQLNEANRIAREATERAAVAETTSQHLRERNAAYRDELGALHDQMIAQSTIEANRRRWWHRK